MKKIDRTVLFQGCHSQFLGSIKRPDLDIWKKSLLNNQYYLFASSRRLEQAGLIIETLEYVVGFAKVQGLSMYFSCMLRVHRFYVFAANERIHVSI